MAHDHRHPPLQFMGPGTLSRELVLRVTALVALIAVALSGLTVIATQQILQDQQDQQLKELGGRPPRDDRNQGQEQTPGGGFSQDGMLYYGSGYYIRTNPGQTFSLAFVQQGRTRVPLSDEVIQQLAGLGTQELATVRLDELGVYRLYSTVDIAGNRTIVGLPSSLISGPLVKEMIAATAMTLAAILLAFFATRAVVQRSLLPLRRLASTAHEVSRLELHSGEVAVPVRVSSVDTDPRSEVGQVGLAFNHMLDNVESALEARQRSEMKVRQFVADASHELRNPLASIRGYAELTRRERDAVPTTTAHALGRIESESERMSSLVEDLLLLARLDSGPSLALTPTHLNELVANAVSDAQVAGPDHEWSLSLPEWEVVAVGDPFRLLQVVANLLANARTHTPAGTHVLTSLSSEGDYAVIRVSDNGPGIPESVRGKVFERFTRADASRVRRGGGGSSTGLGLAIVAAVVQAHRGTASVDSSDAGTTFTIRIPLARQA